MHRPTEVARWYRRVDPHCYTAQATPAVPDRARRIRSIVAVPIGWLTVAYAYVARNGIHRPPLTIGTE